MEISSERVRGRDKEKESIVRFLTESRCKTKVVTIWGIEGIGKTTLARLVCKDDKVQGHFHPLLWANARHAFHLNTIIEDLLELDHDCRGILSIDDLQEQLKRRIEGRTCLIVLDDVGKLAPEQCKELRDLCDVGIAGVLIATVEDQDIDLANKDETGVSRKSPQSHMTIKEKTGSRIVNLGEDVVMEDRKKIIEDFFLRESEENKLYTLSIGGITDAENDQVQSICNDRRVKDKFDFFKWVPVPGNEFKLKKIIRVILGKEEQGKTLDQLRIELRNTLQAKKFLIRLDVYGINAYQHNMLEVLINNGGVGNKLLITTRDKQVQYMKKNLDSLLIADSLNLVVKNAKFAEIGREIIEGCRGVPLLVRIFGGMLSHETDENKLKEIQEKMRNSSVKIKELNSSDVSEILEFSFETLPSRIKKCFLYSTCFTLHPPQRGRLTQQWIAHDLFEGSENNLKLEDLAREYFDELLSRSFFYNLVEDDLMAEARFEVHDLVYKHAHKVSEGECCITSSDQIEKIPSTVLHLVFTNKSENFPSLEKLKKLRTFKWGNFRLSSTTPDTKLDVDNLSRSLRVLDLSGSEFEELPNSIGELRDLRYLDVSYNIYLDELPNSLFKLSNLETLRFEECGIQELPRDFFKLKKLRNLYACTEQGSIPEEVIRGLASLRILHLNPVHNLETLPKSLEYLTDLETLVLRFCSQLTLSDTDIAGLKSLRNLTITHIQKESLIPSSLKDDAASSLSSLCLYYCMGVTTLPEWLVKLQCLRRLHVEFCPNLTPSPKGIFLPNCLEYLSIRGCPELTKICESEDWQKKNKGIREIHLDGRIIRSISDTWSSDATSTSSGQSRAPWARLLSILRAMKDSWVRWFWVYVGSTNTPGPVEEIYEGKANIQSIPQVESYKPSASSSGEGMESAISEEETELCFLLCSFVPVDRDIPIELIIRYAMGMGLFGDATTMSRVRARVNAAMRVLMGHFYLSEITSNSFRMGRYRKYVYLREHKSFIKTGAYLKEWPESDLMDQFTYISLMENNIEKLPKTLKCPRLQLLSLFRNRGLHNIPDSCFQETTKLQVLDLSSREYSSTATFRLPTSLKCLESLRSLLLDFCKLEGDLSVIGNLSKLEILSLRGSDIRELPAEIGRLKQLRLLDLDNCAFLESIPANVIFRLCKLEELYMKRGFKKWEVLKGGTAVSDDDAGKRNASFSEIQSLSSLAVFSAEVGDVNCLPNDFSFSGNLTKFDLQIGKIRSSIPLPIQYANLRQDPSVNNFFLGGGNYHHIQLASLLLPKAGHLILEHVKMTPILSDSDEEGAFNALKSLRLLDCGGLEYLSRRRSTNAAFANLEKLRLEKLVRLKGLGEGVPNPGSFQNLKFLEFRECDQLSGVIPSNWIRNFPKLEHLHVGSCSSVTEIIDTEEIAKDLEMTPPLANIKNLHLKSLKGLLSICKWPGKIISFSNLIELHISDCPNLEFIFSPYMSQTLFHLQKLSIVGCGNLRLIFEKSNGAATDEIQPLEFPELRLIRVHYCKQLRSLFPISTARGLVKLDRLDISDCKNLTEIFEETEEGVAMDDIQPLKLPELRMIRVHYCEQLRSLFPISTARGLAKLQELNISGCIKLTEMFKKADEGAAMDEIQPLGFPELKKFTVHQCEQLMSLFPVFTGRGLAKLEELDISGCKNLDEIFKETEEGAVMDEIQPLGFPKLNKICIDKCVQLRSLFPVSIAQGLENLEKLHITHCNNLVELVSCRDNIRTEREANINEIQIQLRKLSRAILLDLISFKRFCPRGYSLGLPSLGGLYLGKCPKLMELTSHNADTYGLMNIPRVCTIQYRKTDEKESSEAEEQETGAVGKGNSKRLGEGMESAISEEETELCFLLCSFVPVDRDIPIELIIRYAMGMGLFGDATTMSRVRARVNAAMRVLAGHFYLSESASNSFRMGYRKYVYLRDHKSFIKTGAYLKEWPKSDLMDQSTYISLMGSQIQEIPEKLKCPRLQLLSLRGDGWLRCIPNSCFQGSTMLQVLDLSSRQYSSTATFRLPASLKCLESLRSLLLDFCKLEGDISVIGNLSKLEILSLRGSDITNLPVEIGRLNKLRLLDLDGCAYLKCIPAKVISKLLELEELYMKRGFKNWEVLKGGTAVSDDDAGKRNASFSEIQSLSSLTVFSAEVGDVNCLPDDFSFSGNLTKFDLQIGKISSSTPLPDQHADIRQDPWVNNFFLGGVNYRDIQLASSLLPKAGHLTLERVLMTPILNDSVEEGAFEALKSLRLRDCGGLKYLGRRRSTNAAFANLEELWLTDLISMKGLLTICQSPGKIISFSNLIELHISDCPQLAFIFPPYNSQTLFHLRKLSIARCDNLRVICEKADEGAAMDEIQPLGFPELKKFTVHQCEQLMSLFPVFTGRGLAKLEELDISGCKNLDEIFKETEEGAVMDEIQPLGFPKLNKICIDKCVQLRSLFPVSIAQGLENLEKLDITHCNNLVELVSCRDNIRTEREANINEIQIQLRKLSRAILLDLISFKRFCPRGYSLGLPSLGGLYLGKCPKLMELTSHNADTYGLMNIPRVCTIQYRKTDEKESSEAEEQETGAVGKGNSKRLGEGMESAISEEETELCFLLCSFVPVDRDIPIELIIRYAMGMGLFGDATTMSRVRARVNAAMRVLAGHFYLSESASNSFRMGYRKYVYLRDHKSFIKTGAYLKEWPKSDLMDQSTYISLMGSQIQEIPEKLKCPRLQLLSLRGDGWLRCIPNSCFQGSTMLQVLDLSSRQYSSTATFRLPASLKCLESLRSLLLDFCKLEGDISVIGNLSKLEILSLRGSDITNLPVEIGRLNKLRLLDLDGCAYLKCIPAKVISKLLELEELYMKRGFKNWEVLKGGTAVSDDDAGKRNASFSEIQSLSSLTVFSAEVGDVNCLPDDFSFSGNLTKFDLQIGKISSSTPLPDQHADIRQDPWVNNFFLGGVNYRHSHILASSLLPKAAHLILEHVLMTPILNYSDEDGAFDALKSLRLRDCGGLEYLGRRKSTNSAFANLKVLWLADLISMRGLLTICQRPGKIISFSNLIELHISDCPQLAFIFPPYNSQTLFHLRKLSIARCDNLRVICEKADEGAAMDEIQPLGFPELKKFTVHQCEQLMSLFPVFTGRGLAKLEELDISGCKNLDEIFKETEEGAVMDEIQPLGFPKLNKICIDKCVQLRSLFPVSIAQGLENLEKLDITHCNNLVELVSCRDNIRTEREANTNEIQIQLRKLSRTILLDLISFKRFCPRGYSLGLPSLGGLYLGKCPKLMEITSHNADTYGLMNIPRLCRIEYRKTDFIVSEAEVEEQETGAAGKGSRILKLGEDVGIEKGKRNVKDFFLKESKDTTHDKQVPPIAHKKKNSVLKSSLDTPY